MRLLGEREGIRRPFGGVEDEAFGDDDDDDGAFGGDGPFAVCLGSGIRGSAASLMSFARSCLQDSF